MKLLYLPLLAGGNNEQKYLEKALRKHFEVEVFDYCAYNNPEMKFLAAVERFAPDIIHLQIQACDQLNTSFLEAVRSRHPKMVITQWTGDVRTEPIPQTVKAGRFCHITFVASLSDVIAYKEAGLFDVRYWQNAAANPEQVGKPTNSPRGIVFCGANYTVYPGSTERRDLVEAFAEEFGEEFQVFGHGWQYLGHSKLLPWDEQTRLYEKAYLILGHHHLEDKRYWCSDRQFIAMASGRPHLTKQANGLEEIFANDEEVAFYTSIAEAVAKAKGLLSDPERAKRIGLKGQEAIKKGHTWDKRAQEYSDMVNDYLC